MSVVDTGVITDHSSECPLMWIDVGDTSAPQTISYTQGELVYYTEVMIVEEDKENPRTGCTRQKIFMPGCPLKYCMQLRQLEVLLSMVGRASAVGWAGMVGWVGTVGRAGMASRRNSSRNRMRRAPFCFYAKSATSTLFVSVLRPI
jgi:hypothetical protein